MNKTARSALTEALAIQQRAAAVGFDWPDAEGPRAKIAEEFAELEHAVGHSRDSASSEINEELGDLLFAVANDARHLDVEPEAALTAANEKFRRRFRYIEERLAVEGLHPRDVNLTRLDALWEDAKCSERTENSGG
ncbi:MAG: MazG nucleotide pyrophosphohydrolase domain-containing protein [Gammaproteobacteria bacterium]